MVIPPWVSVVAPVVPLAIRAVILAMCAGVARRPLGGMKKVEEHRTLIIALAGFSLAGIAIIGTQSDQKFGPPFFDITVSFICYVASLAVQGWKAFVWQDQLGDGLRDAATTALLLFIVQLATVVAPGLAWERWQTLSIAAAAAVAWILDPGFPLVVNAGYLWEEDGNDGR